MKLYNKDIKTPTQILVAECKDTKLINDLIKEVRFNMQFKKDMPAVTAESTPYESLVNSKNLLKFIKVNALAFKKYYPGFAFKIVDAWGNIYKKNNHYCKIHNHYGSTGFSAIIFLTDGPGPGTYFKEYDLLIKERKGRFILFHPLINHEVKNYNYKKERITIAFNCNAVSSYEPSVLNLC